MKTIKVYSSKYIRFNLFFPCLVTSSSPLQKMYIRMVSMNVKTSRFVKNIRISS